MKTDYEFTDFTTNKIMNILSTMERDVCKALCDCKDIKDGLFKVGTYMGGARLKIYNVLKAEQDKSYEAKDARIAEKIAKKSSEKESEE